MSRFLIVLGIALLIAGLLWPWSAKLGLGRLPGAIAIKGEHVRFTFPITTGLLISFMLTLILWLFRR